MADEGEATWEWLHEARKGKEDCDDGCTYSKVRRKSCTTVEDPETKKPVLRCDKLEQLLKHCPGRRPEVVESKTEHTEEEVTTGDKLIPGLRDEHIPLGIFGGHGNNEDGLFSRFPDIIEDHLSSGLEGFLQAAEEMANELFGQFGFYRREHPDRSDGPDGPRRPPFENGRFGRRHHRAYEEDKDDSFSDYRHGFKEV